MKKERKMENNHYFSSQPAVKSKKKVINTRIRGIDFEFISDTGVFSRGGIDFGSALLIESAAEDLKSIDKDGYKVLDFGCGYGPAGIILKRIFPEITVYMTDINQRAIELASENAKINHVRYVNIFRSDMLEGTDETYNVILTNPPVRAGKDTVFSFYLKSYEKLKANGILFVVIQKKQGASSSEKKLLEIFGNCETINKKSGYRILKSKKTVNSDN